MKRLFILLLVWGAVSASARELEWTRWLAVYRYVDLELNCSTNHTNDYFYFGFQRGAAGVTYAEFRDELSEFSQSFSPVPAPLLASVQVAELVKGLTLNPTMVNWVMTHQNADIWECQPPVALKDISPGTAALTFVPGLDMAGKTMWESNEVKFTGHRVDGIPYQLTLSFKQYRK